MYECHQGLKRHEINTEARARHIDFLRESYYKVETKWPQFELMLREAEELARELDDNATVLILERSYFCGGYSLLGPIFSHCNVICVDCVVGSAVKTFGKQLSWLDDDRFIKWRPNYVNKISALDSIESGSVDCVYVPNVVHHEREQRKMFDELYRVTRDGGICSIFEGLVRELHHLPDDYLRYTPGGMQHMFAEAGFSSSEVELGTGVFDVIGYVWLQALEFFPEDERDQIQDWFFKSHFPWLRSLDQRLKTNLLNPEKSFPMSFAVRAYKNKMSQQ